MTISSAKAERPSAAAHSPRQFTLRELLADVAMFAVFFALMRFGLSPHSRQLGVIALTAVAPLVAAWISLLLSPFSGDDRPPRRRRFALSFATIGAAAQSPVIIAMEWGRDHPWPASDAAYVLLAFLRCCLSGCALGWIAATLFALFVSQPDRFFVPHFDARKLITVAAFVAALLLVWLPTAPWYWQKHLIGRFQTAVMTGTSEEVAESVERITWPGGKAVVKALAWYQALQAPDAEVKTRALQALKLLGDAADENVEASLKPLLDDEHEGVREAAAELLEIE